MRDMSPIPMETALICSGISKKNPFFPSEPRSPSAPWCPSAVPVPPHTHSGLSPALPGLSVTSQPVLSLVESKNARAVRDTWPGDSPAQGTAVARATGQEFSAFLQELLGFSCINHGLVCCSEMFLISWFQNPPSSSLFEAAASLI